MGGTRKKVLWVDDEIEFLRAHIMFLETRGYSVIPVFSGDDAIHMLREKDSDFDIVLLDEQMPGKDGLATLEEIKEMFPGLPVVMVTKSEEERVMEDALGKKIDGYLTKPVNPSQILMVCKRLLDSKQIISDQITQRFVRGYSENRMLLNSPLDAPGWVRLYENLTKWDFELEKVHDEGLRQTHAGQKSDGNAAFSSYVMEHYGAWVKGAENPPSMSTDVVRKILAPRCAEGKRVFFIILEGMRLDQYFAVEMLLRDLFTIERHYYYSILPTSSIFSRASLFSGMFPADIARQWPEWWKKGGPPEQQIHPLEPEFLSRNLRGLNVDIGKRPAFVSVGTSAEVQQTLRNLDTHARRKLVTMVVSFVDLLIQSHATSPVLKEIAPDESAFRNLTQSWFQYSPLYQLLQELSRIDCTIILTTDHGSIFCTRGSEVYGSKGLPRDVRYSFEKNITCDERHAVYLADPAIYKLPAIPTGTTFVIAKENYYFIYPDKFENYQQQYQNGFRYGGISMEEIILPLAVMRPKAA
jgi:CheY-like chemotaxis protein